MKAALLIIADDLTGAMDTGVKCSARGISSYVAPCFREGIFDAPPAVRVLIVNTESRHLPPREAYDRVFSLTAAAKAYGVGHIYKKTDSALRGNIGAELSAVLDASRAAYLPFLPAYPMMNRVTKDGYHWIDGVLAAESVFGKDPFTPVVQSYLPDLLAAQCARQVLICRPGMVPANREEPSVAVFDAETEEELRLTGQALCKGTFDVSAGCAGFAEFLPDLLAMKPETVREPRIHEATLYVCGSVSPITMEQLVTAKANGFAVYEADDGITDEGFCESDAAKALAAQITASLRTEKRAVLASAICAETLARRRERNGGADAAAAPHVHIANNLALLTRKLAEAPGGLNLVFFGGDTVGAFIKVMDVKGMTPAAELVPGVVLAEADGAQGALTMVTKSGGFGGADVVARIDDCLALRLAKQYELEE